MVPKPGDIFKIRHDNQGVFVIVDFKSVLKDKWLISYKVLSSDWRVPGEVIVDWDIDAEDFNYRFILIPASPLMRKLYAT